MASWKAIRTDWRALLLHCPPLKRSFWRLWMIGVNAWQRESTPLWRASRRAEAAMCTWLNPSRSQPRVREEIPLAPQTEATTTRTASPRFLHNMARVMDYIIFRGPENEEATLLADMILAYLYQKGCEGWRQDWGKGHFRHLTKAKLVLSTTPSKHHQIAWNQVHSDRI